MLSLSFQQFLLLFLFLTLHSSYQSIRNNRHKAHNIGSTDHLLQDEEDTKEKLGVLLGKMDPNLDQQIDRKELHAWILKSLKLWSEEDSNDKFENADVNRDKLVTWSEYKEEEYDGMDDWVDIEMDRFLFMAADTKDGSLGDGSLDVKEYLSFSYPQEDPAMRALVLAQVLKEKDTDGNGRLSFEEYVGKRDQEKDEIEKKKSLFDSELDKNGDASLDTEEILTWIIPTNEEIATDEVTQLFSGADKDGDELLTFEEVLNNYALFVVSEATDHGGHLHNLEVLDHRFGDEL